MTDLDLLIRDKYEGDATRVTEEDKARLEAGEPLAYVIGWVPFLDVHVDLSSKPLIPRPETEWWTELLIEHINDTSIYSSVSEVRVLDMCAGSGAVGLAVLKHLPNATVTFAELESEHLITIENSVKANNLDASRAHYATGDLFENVSGTFDVIACNPPYIPATRTLDASVTGFEPHEALFSGEDGLVLIRRIAHEAKEYINAGGELWLEADIENIEQAAPLFTEHGATHTTIKQDLYGRYRLVIAYY